MTRSKKAALSAVILGVAIVPATAFAAGGHHGHHANLHLYHGAVATATSTSPLAVSNKRHATPIMFVLTSKTRYVVDHQRQMSEPSFTVGERVLVKARELKNGSFVARLVRLKTA